MTLTRHIETVEGERFEMAGIFPFGTRMLPRRKALGYTEVVLRKNCLLGDPGLVVRGHEFHYSQLESLSKDSKFAYDLSIGIGIKNNRDGLFVYNTLASYMHVHFAQKSVVNGFVKACVSYSRS